MPGRNLWNFCWFVLILGLAMPVALPAADFGWITNNGAITITVYGGLGGSVSIPETINGLPVTAIGPYVFACDAKVTEVTVPETVTNIGESAFEACFSLTNAAIGNNLVTIGESAFQNCGKLTSIRIPKTVLSIGASAFSQCYSLVEFAVDDLNPRYSSVDGTLFDRNATTLVQCPGGKTGSYTMPDTVTNIGPLAFRLCTHVLHIDMPEKLRSIGTGAFFECAGLTNLIIPDGVTSIADAAFGGCSSLVQVTLPNSLTSIPARAFISCVNLDYVTIPEGVTNIGDLAFSGCSNLVSMTMPQGLTHIGDYAFQNCANLRSCAMGESLTSIGALAFSECIHLTNLIFPNHLRSIGTRAFYECESLTSLTLPNGISGIENETFARCEGLTNVIIPDSVISIGDRAFENCYLAALTLSNVETIGSYAFTCRGLHEIKLGSRVRALGLEAFWGFADLTAIYCEGDAPYCSSLHLPSTTTVYYRLGTTGWNATFGGAPAKLWDPGSGLCFLVTNSTVAINGFAGSRSSVNIPNTIAELPVTSIADNAFYVNSGLTNVVVAEGVTGIGDWAFDSCVDLARVILPDTVTNIGNGAFYGCTSLAEILLPNSVTRIGDSAFSSCRALTRVSLGKNLISIGSFAFSGCDSLPNVTLPRGFTTLGKGAFYACPSLAGIYFQGDAPTMDGPLVLSGSSSLVVYHFPNTANWESTFAGHPTALWNLALQTNGTRPSAQTNGFGFTVAGTPNIPLVLEFCAELSNPAWIPLATNQLTDGSLRFNDPLWTNYPSGFYRVSHP